MAMLNNQRVTASILKPVFLGASICRPVTLSWCASWRRFHSSIFCFWECLQVLVASINNWAMFKTPGWLMIIIYSLTNILGIIIIHCGKPFEWTGLVEWQRFSLLTLLNYMFTNRYIHFLRRYLVYRPVTISINNVVVVEHWTYVNQH